MATGMVPEFGLEIVNLYAPAGTRIPMQQAAPPLGWTSDTSTPMTDCSMRINSGTGGGNGGTTGWSSWNFGGVFNVNAFSLSIAQLAAHAHTDVGHGHGVNDGGHAHLLGAAYCYLAGGGDLSGNGGTNVHYQNNGTTAATTGVSIQAGFAGITNTGSGAAIQPNYTTPQVKYADHIMAVKS